MRTIVLLSCLSLFACAAEAAAPAFVTEIPFDSCKGMICLQAMPDDGKPVTLLLDTGDAHNFISVDAAKAHGWMLKPYVGKDGKPVDGIFDAGSHVLSLGKLSQPVAFLAMSAADMGSQGTYEGNLVYTFFKDRILQIDYPNHMLRVSAALSGMPATDKARGYIKIVNFHTWGPPIVTGGPFTINGQPVEAQIDTGYTGSMLIYTKAIDRLGLGELSKQGVGELFPFTDGGVTMLAAKAQSEGFADAVIDAKKPTVYFPTPGVHEPDSPFEATVGNALFKNSVVTLDFHAMTLDVRPAAGG